MITITRGLAAGAVLAGAALGFAGPASAEPLSGPYKATAIKGNFGMQTGTVSNWTLSPCGGDCTHLHTGAGKELNLHLQDSVWTGVDRDCAVALDNTSLVYTVQCSDGRIVFQLSKDA